jgi:hypothetical protein
MFAQLGARPNVRPIALNSNDAVLFVSRPVFRRRQMRALRDTRPTSETITASSDPRLFGSTYVASDRAERQEDHILAGEKRSPRTLIAYNAHTMACGAF